MPLSQSGSAKVDPFLRQRSLINNYECLEQVKATFCAVTQVAQLPPTTCATISKLRRKKLQKTKGSLQVPKESQYEDGRKRNAHVFTSPRNHDL